MGRWSHCYADVHLNKVQILCCYKGKSGRQNVITQAGILWNTELNKIIL